MDEDDLYVCYIYEVICVCSLMCSSWKFVVEGNHDPTTCECIVK